MNILIVGLNHKTADVDIRERLAFNGQKLEEGLQRIKTLPDVKEAVILSTCNRVEIYAAVTNAAVAHEAIKISSLSFTELTGAHLKHHFTHTKT